MIIGDRKTGRRPFRDNPRLILAGIALLVAILAIIVALIHRTPALTPDVLSEVVLYALSVGDATILVVFLWLLGRNIIKLIVEHRRGLPFARFRSKLVALLLGMTLVPAVLVLLVGSELIFASVDRWFNAPMDEMLASGNRIAGDYYRERQAIVADQAARSAHVLAAAGVNLSSVGGREIGRLLEAGAALQRVQMIVVYRVASPPRTPGAPDLQPVFEMTSPAVPLPAGYRRSAADRLAAQALSGAATTGTIEALETSGHLLYAAAAIRSASGPPAGVVVATGYVTGEVAARSRRMTEAFEEYKQLRVLKRPLTGVYVSFFLMMTLLILFGATWIGSYLAKRITRPVQMLAAAAREIGAGRLDQRLEVLSHDEFGTLVDAFNAMAGELASSRRNLERSTVALERKHEEVERRRRYIETILERITTGVVAIDGAGAITTVNSAAVRLLSLEPSIIGRPAAAVLDRPDLRPLVGLLAGARRSKDAPAVQELAIPRGGQEVHLAAVATALAGEGGAGGGVVLVVDDVTPLIRAQKVAAWREVARRLAHEIKNPLTPIQLCAERLRRHFGGAPPSAQALVDECTTTIVGEVESLKGLVDEFSQFARMPAPRTMPTDLDRLVVETLSLYDGIFTEVAIDHKLDPGVPLVRLDAEQIRRVIINLVDNAIEAMDRKGRILVETGLDAANGVVRITIADDGPGIPPAEREKLFLPYYSTKRRGSGLGLAIVRRIIAEHGGSIEVSDNAPRGTRFTIELPC